MSKTRRNTLNLEINPHAAQSMNNNLVTRSRDALPLSRHHQKSTRPSDSTLLKPYGLVDAMPVMDGDRPNETITFLVPQLDHQSSLEDADDPETPSDTSGSSMSDDASTTAVGADTVEVEMVYVPRPRIAYTGKRVSFIDDGPDVMDEPLPTPTASVPWLRHLEAEMVRSRGVPLRCRVLSALHAYMTSPSTAASQTADELDGVYHDFLRDPGTVFMFAEPSDLERFALSVWHAVLAMIAHMLPTDDAEQDELIVLLRALLDLPASDARVIGASGWQFDAIPTFDTVLRNAWTGLECTPSTYMPATTPEQRVTIYGFLGRIAAAGL